MKNKKRKNVERVLDNWRNITDKTSRFATGYFMGCWTMMDDEEASYLLTHLTKKEFEYIMNYPIWM